jgi:two-component system, NtrC family, response regulator AtoC
VIANEIEIARVLVVSRDPEVLGPLWSIRGSNNWQLEIASNAWEAMASVQAGGALDLLLLDLPQRDAEVSHALRWLRRLRPALPIVLIGHPDDVGWKQELIRMGAHDFLAKPIDDRQLEIFIQHNLATAREANEMDFTSDDVEPVSDGSFFIGISPIMRALRAQAALLAEINVPVLILGEHGSGKETTARLVHKLSVRSGFEFATVNCAVLPGDLLERELFGYEKMPTTASSRTKPGKLELAAKGTILLNEITEMPLELQSKLLQVLQNKRFIKPGTSSFIEIDVRILAASPTNVERAVSENRLRKDLYDHLRPCTICVPPLRERKEELPFLSRHLMHQLAKQYGLPARDFSSAITDVWQAYNWPGNLGELEHLVKRYLMVGDKELACEWTRTYPEGGAREPVSARLSSMNRLAPSLSQSGASVTGFNSLRSLLQSVKSETERTAIAMALEKTGWNRKAAARALKVSYRSLLYKIDQYHMASSDSVLLPREKGLSITATEFVATAVQNGRT